MCYQYMVNGVYAAMDYKRIFIRVIQEYVIPKSEIATIIEEYYNSYEEYSNANV